jgi:two-component system sensor histidine kinase PhcS
MNLTRRGHEPGWQAEQQQYLLFYSRATCVVTIVLMLGGIGLDLAFYPDRLAEFALVRLLASCVIGAVLLSYAFEWGRRHLQWLTYFWLCVPQLAICWMIGRTEGEQSIYFVGLTFALSGIGFFLPLTLLEAIAFGLGTVLAYVAACLLSPSGVEQPSTLAGNMLFLLFYAVVCAVIAVYSGRWRRQSWQLKQAVERANDDLRQTNAALAEVKGHMIQQEKMAALGTLSAGLLHEVNNPVNYSMMALNMALADPAAKASADLNESLVDAREGMQRVQNIVSDLKTFAYQKPGENPARVFVLEKAVDSARRLAGHELKGVRFEVELPMDTHVVGDEPGLIGVLINLFSNAALALQKSGRAEPRIMVRGRAQDGRLHLAVRDNGTGIAPEHMTRVFDPFFTTRDVGQGLGLGLSVSYAIVQRHGGELRVASEPGAWTEFELDLAQANAGGATTDRGDAE